MSPADERSRVRGALGIALLAGPLLGAPAQDSGGGWELLEPAPEVALIPPRLEGLEGYRCADCHSRTVEEWASTAHATAWVDEVYQEAIENKRRPELCHSCHIPERVLAATPPKRPKARAVDPHLGISCEACHAGADGLILGPRGTQVEAHPGAASPFMSPPGSNALCASCHSTNIGPVVGIAKDFARSDQEARGRACVACHMAPVERRWADDEDAPVRMGRSHALQTPRDPTFLRRAFELEMRTDGTTRIVVHNAIAHRVPGLKGRKIVFRAELLDAAGAVVEEVGLTLTAAAYLPVDGSAEIRFTSAGIGARVVGQHLDPRANGPIVFLDETFPAKKD